MLYIILVIIFIIAIYILGQYNNFVRLSNSAKEAFSTMDIYLKKRWDLIPNLVETVKGYANHESEVFENIAKLRNASYDGMSASEKIYTNKQMSNAVSRLIAVAENYPELKANSNFSDLSNQLSKIEEDIANSRKYYNGVVRKFNTCTEIFPSNIVAKIFDFKALNMFEADEKERENVKVEF